MLLKSLKWILLSLAVVLVGIGTTVIVIQEPVAAPGTYAIGNVRIYNRSYAEPSTQVSESMEGYRTSLVSPSLSVAVAVRGTVVYADARGYADIKSQIQATPDTVYAIGSVSKPLTAAVTAVLWEHGLLDIDADIRQYVPAFPEREHRVTLRQLLSHQAGIRHYAFQLSFPTMTESDLDREFSNIEESLTLFVNDELLFEPDTDFTYSTFGYTLIAAAIEHATNQSYESALGKYVLDPLGLSSTTIDDAAHIEGTRATDYVATFSKKAVVRAPSTNSSYKRAGGGLVSTPTDLVRFGSTMLGNTLLSEATRDAIFTARQLPDGELNPQHYGLGWRIGGLVVTDEVSGKESIIPLWNHGGTRAGSTAILMIVPDYEIVVAMSSNTVGRGASGPLTSIAAKVAREFIRFESNARASTLNDLQEFPQNDSTP